MFTHDKTKTYLKYHFANNTPAFTAMFKPDLIGLASVKRTCVSSGVAKLSVELSLSTKTTLFFNRSLSNG